MCALTKVEPAAGEQISLPPRRGDPLQMQLDALNAFEGVRAGHPSDRARVCVAVGCPEEVFLAAIILEGFGKRVLCPTHALKLVDREVGLE